MAKRIAKSKYESRGELAQAAIELAWGQPPGPESLKKAEAFLAKVNPAKLSGREPPLVDFCHVLLNASPFLYID